MRFNATTLVMLLLLAGTIAFIGAPARAHDWYPKECCGGGDCAPADYVMRREDGSYIVMALGTSVLIPADYNQWKISPDGRIHVCIGEYLISCAFRGPGV